MMELFSIITYFLKPKVVVKCECKRGLIILPIPMSITTMTVIIEFTKEKIDAAQK